MNPASVLTRNDWWSITITFALGGALIALAIPAFEGDWIIALGTSTGALGGFAHELAQSRGRILSFRRTDDGVYIGTLAAMVLGAVAGLLVVSSGKTTDANQIVYNAFLGGLSLKGIAEAATTAPAPAIPSPTPGSQSTPSLSELIARLPATPSIAIGASAASTLPGGH